MQRLTRTLAAASALAFASLLAGCGDDVSIEPDPSITLTPPSASLQVGQSAQFSATVVGLANKTVTWSSSDNAKATVDNTGKVTAVAAGTATIIAATSDANVKASAIVTITAVSKGVTKVEISPNADILGVGQTRQLTANVTRDPGIAGTVTWASSNTAVATVSTSGVVTAVTAGSTVITAASTVDPTVTGTAAITVRPPQAATISIQKVTVTGNTNATVNFTNVAGGIDVTLNVDPGDQVLQRVEVLLDGTVVCTQNFSASQSREMSLAAAFEELEAVDVVCQINTAEFAAATGVPKYTNGQRQLSARAIVQGGTQTATPSVALTFNNQNGIVVTVTNDNGADPASAVNPNTGLAWTGGSATINVVGVSYTPNISVASASLTLFGKTRTIALTNGVGSVTYSEGTTWTATNTGLGNYLSPSAGETAGGATAVLSNGANLVTTGSVILNFTNAPAGNATIPVLQTIRHDNTAPGQTSANGIVQQAPTIGTMPVWVNATTAFSAGNVGIPTATALQTTETVAGPVTSGVDNVTATVFFGGAGANFGPGAATYNPGGLANGTGACNLTGLTAITVGQNLPETTVSASYQARVQLKDALGNAVCYDLNPFVAVGDPANGTFGADFQAPTITAANIVGGVANNVGVTATPTAFNFSAAAVDNASGFNAATAVTTTLSVQNVAGTSCVVGTTANGCTATEALNAATAGSATQGYYTATYTIKDQAGNAATVINRFYLFDNTAPAFSGGLSLQSLYTGNQAATFTIAISDNLDLNTLTGVVTYAGVDSLQTPPQSFGSFGLPLERTATANYTIANFIACLTQAGSFAAGTKASQVGLTLTDQANNSALFGAPGNIPATNVANCSTVGNTAFAAGGWTQSAPVFGAGKTQVDIDGATLAAASQTTVGLVAVADVPLNTTVAPFNTVNFYYRPSATSPLRLIGSATALLQQTVSNRTYTYSLTWDPDANVPAGAIQVYAIGIDANGNGVLTGAQTVTTVP